MLGVAPAACAERPSELDAGGGTDGGAVHDAGSLDAGLDAQAPIDATTPSFPYYLDVDCSR